MRRARLFLAVLLGATSALVAVTLWYLFIFQENTGSISGMMGQMAGNRNGGGMLNPMPTGVWVGFLALSVVAAVGISGFAYYAALPEFPSSAQGRPAEERTGAEPGMSWSALIRTSNEDERKVLEVLEAHNGKYLQKFIVKESGLSKLKTHRILSRFAERGVVTAEKKGNTNEISLTPWLAHSRPAP